MPLAVIKEKLKSAAWFLRRPELYPQFIYFVIAQLSGPEADTREETLRWCEASAISTSDAIERVCGHKLADGIWKAHESVMGSAEKATTECPVKMGGPGDLDLLYAVVKHLKAKRVVETGVAYGWSSLAILLGMKDDPEGRLISIDMPYLKMNNDQWVGIAVPASLKEKWKLLRLADRQGLPIALSEMPEIDLCHYDSDKTYRGRAWAYSRLWGALRAGGVFISDDVQDNLGFRDFAKSVKQEPIVVRVGTGKDTKYAGVLIKEASNATSG